MGNCLVTKLKEDINNPNLPVFTPYGALQQNVGKWVNRLIELGGTPTTSEITALNNLVSAFQGAGILDSIAYFFPFLENPNIPLFGTKELLYSDEADARLDFVDGALRGYKRMAGNPNIGYSDLFPGEYGVMIGGSAIFKAPSSMKLNTSLQIGTDYNNCVSHNFYTSRSLQTRFEIRHISNGGNASTLSIEPAISFSENGDNLFFAQGLGNEETNNPNSATTIQNNTVIMNGTGKAPAYIHQSLITEQFVLMGTGAPEAPVCSFTTIATFKRLLSKNEGKAFAEAVKAFCEATGKTIVV